MMEITRDDKSVRISTENMNFGDDQVEYGIEDQIISRECRSLT